MRFCEALKQVGYIGKTTSIRRRTWAPGVFVVVDPRVCGLDEWTLTDGHGRCVQFDVMPHEVLANDWELMEGDVEPVPPLVGGGQGRSDQATLRDGLVFAGLVVAAILLAAWVVVAMVDGVSILGL